MTPTAVAGISVIAVITGVVICLAMIIRFFWKIYDRGGPGHVRTVAKALRDVYDPSWPTKMLKDDAGGDASRRQNTDALRNRTK